jgi:DNA-binding FrmR family transcriptional regulator
MGPRLSFYPARIRPLFASWLNKKGVTLKPERYKQILLERLNEIKIHGQTQAIKYFPGYLKHVLQTHLKHHGQDYYDEGKALRALTENALSTLAKLGHSHTRPD